MPKRVGCVRHFAATRDQLRLEKLRQPLFDFQRWQARHFPQHLGRKLATDGCADLRDLAQTIDLVEPRHQRIVQGRWDGCVWNAFRHANALALRGNPALKERLGQLLDEEGVPRQCAPELGRGPHSAIAYREPPTWRALLFRSGSTG